jgi:hypothetical protein
VNSCVYLGFCFERVGGEGNLFPIQANRDNRWGKLWNSWININSEPLWKPKISNNIFIISTIIKSLKNKCNNYFNYCSQSNRKPTWHTVLCVPIFNNTLLMVVPELSVDYSSSEILKYWNRIAYTLWLWTWWKSSLTSGTSKLH